MKANNHLNPVSLAVTIAAFIFTSAASANINKTYQLRGEAPTGTLIKPVEAVSNIPFNKRFVDLTENEKALFKAKYDEIGAMDTPPFPHKGLRAIYRPVIKANKSIEATGSLHLAAKVNADGFVESVEVVNSPDVKLAAAAKKALLSTRFDPATCNGVACAMDFPLEIKFK